MSVKFVCGNCGADNEIPPPATLGQRVHNLLAAIDAASPHELEEVAKEMKELAQSPASKIVMRVIYRDISKVLQLAAKS